jgi:hypothetical protein
VAGLNANQSTLSPALQVSEPPPVLLMLKVWGAGLPPCVATKERFVGLAPIAGGMGTVATVSVTGTVTEEAPGAFTVTEPL